MEFLEDKNCGSSLFSIWHMILGELNTAQCPIQKKQNYLQKGRDDPIQELYFSTNTAKYNTRNP